MSGQTATVEVLAAEVRVLMVGSRQVTLSVYAQLDMVDVDYIEPFGRVHFRKRDAGNFVDLVGKDSRTGVLVRSSVPRREWVMEEHDETAKDLLQDIRECEWTASEQERALHPQEAEDFRQLAAAARSSLKIRWSYLSSKAEETARLPLIVLAGLK